MHTCTPLTNLALIKAISSHSQPMHNVDGSRGGLSYLLRQGAGEVCRSTDYAAQDRQRVLRLKKTVQGASRHLRVGGDMDGGGVAV